MIFTLIPVVDGMPKELRCPTTGRTYSRVEEDVSRDRAHYRWSEHRPQAPEGYRDSQEDIAVTRMRTGEFVFSAFRSER